MRRLTPPRYEALATFDSCVSAIASQAARKPFIDNRAHIEVANAAFDAACVNANWLNLPRAAHGKGQAQVVGTITKAAMVDLYSTYMVKAVGPSRDIYDAIFAAAGGLCPFCGGLGHVKTLDHYLPKARFPAHAVHPYNLVPSCYDCNTGKNAATATDLGAQILHPYFDAVHFFEERWIRAEVRLEDPVTLKFFCCPPANWNDVDTARAHSHFSDNNLAIRFSVQAGAELAKVVSTRAGTLRQLTPQHYGEFLLESANATKFVLNGWNRTMYAVLSQTAWFVEADFSDPNWLAIAQVEV